MQPLMTSGSRLSFLQMLTGSQPFWACDWWSACAAPAWEKCRRKRHPARSARRRQ